MKNFTPCVAKAILTSKNVHDNGVKRLSQWLSQFDGWEGHKKREYFNATSILIETARELQFRFKGDPADCPAYEDMAWAILTDTRKIVPINYNAI